MFNRCYIEVKNYMFRPVVAIIRSLSIDSLKIVNTIVWRRESIGKDLMMATTGRNM